MSTRTSRRSFLKSATIAGAAISLNAVQYSRVYGANSRFGIASIGTGGKGWSDLNGVAASPDVQVIALCDIDSSAKHLGQAAEKYRSARQYDDWRKLLDESKDIQGVLVSTPGLHACTDFIGRHALGQTCVLPKATHAHRLRSAANANGRREIQFGDADVQSDSIAFGLPHGGAYGSYRHDRKGQRSPFVARGTTILAKTHTATARQRSRARPCALGSLARRCAGAAVQGWHVPSVQLARLASIRHRTTWRFRMPHFGSRFQIAQTHFANQTHGGGANIASRVLDRSRDGAL